MIPPPTNGSTSNSGRKPKERHHFRAIGTSQVLPPGYRNGLRLGTDATLTIFRVGTLTTLLEFVPALGHLEDLSPQVFHPVCLAERREMHRRHRVLILSESTMLIQMRFSLIVDSWTWSRYYQKSRTSANIVSVSDKLGSIYTAAECRNNTSPFPSATKSPLKRSKSPDMRVSST